VGDEATRIKRGIMYVDKLGKIRVTSRNAFEVPLNELVIFLRKFRVSSQPLGTFLYGGNVYKTKMRQINAHWF
jgi:hypothetical protein